MYFGWDVTRLNKCVVDNWWGRVSLEGLIREAFMAFEGFQIDKDKFGHDSMFVTIWGCEKLFQPVSWQ